MNDLAKATDLVERIRPILAGHTPEAIGACLGELAATHIASLAPPLRADARNMLVSLIDDLIPVMVQWVIDTGKAPDGVDWR